MSNRIHKFGLILFYLSVIFFFGCIPEDTLEWSDDGSVGLLRVEGALYLVDGETGELTEIAADSVQPWPDISKDGSLIAYSRVIHCDNLSEGLKMLPDGQVKMITYYAGKMAKDIISEGGLIDNKFPEPPVDILKPDDVKEWVIRFLCENADDELTDALGEEGMKLGKGKELEYNQVTVVPKKNFNDKSVITTSIFPIMGTRLSPDKQYVAYIVNAQYTGEDIEYSLYIASLKDDIKDMLVEQRVAIGFDWSIDSKRIAYMNADSSDLDEDMVLGTLNEIEVADANDALLCIQHDIPEEGAVQTYDCTKGAESLAGLIYYPWLKVRYGIEGRIFFSTCVMSLPMSKNEEGGWSLFCYDPLTGTVTNVLPQTVSNLTYPAMNMLQFELSPDGKKVLLPIKYNRLIDYEFGTDKVGLPIFEDEGFGEDEISQLVPTFKGNKEITFLVSGDSHYFTETIQEKPDRNEIIALDRTALKGRILSESWPDEILENLTD